MFVRVVESTIQPGKKPELLNLLHNELLPLVRKQHGFVDSIGMIGDPNPEQALGLTLWETRTDAENVMTLPEYRKLMDRINQLVTGMTVRGFMVEVSTFHQIAAAKVA